MIGTFLQISIIEKIRNICERIFISQTQKFKVENMIERIIENKPTKSLKMTASGTYPFIEYMSYRLKRYGKDGLPYLMAFEEQVNKMGLTISEAIAREHFDIAVRKLSMKNSITSIRNISRLNIASIFKEINEVEKILNEDPIGVYPKMDYTSKDYYRSKILEISKKAKISEIFVAKEAIRLSNEANTKEDETAESKGENINQQKKSHVGYYLIDDGYRELMANIIGKNIHKNKPQYKTQYNNKMQDNNKESALNNSKPNLNKSKPNNSDSYAKIYVASIYFFTILITAILFRHIKIGAILLFIPIQNAVTQIIRHIILRKIKPRHIPKIELEDGIPEELATMCVIPVTLKSEKDVKEIFKKMEVYYLANKSENLYFTLLGDCTNSTSQEQKKDKDIVEEGINQSKKLNEKYGQKFFFAYRKREWSEGERCFMGWERKRGMINQFNEFLITGVSKFKVNTCDINNISKIKYVITIDSDTNLIMDSAKKLVGAMSHILNKPEIDKIKNIVVKGYGIIQPRVSIDIEESRRSLFTRIFSDGRGLDMYSGASSDIYQDLFGEGIFTGKGIYDLDVFYSVLRDSIPENTVLSHDLLEGNFLRCGLANDIFVADGCPSNYDSYKTRKHRWIRGDIQILGWLNSNLNFLSKYKIWDNLVRNLNEVFIFIVLLTGIVEASLIKIVTPLVLLSMPLIINVMHILLTKKDGTTKNKLLATNFSSIKALTFKTITDILLIPDTANLETNAIFKALYRMKISHNYLLEWTTASEAESKPKKSLKKYYASMIFSVIIGAILIIFMLSRNLEFLNEGQENIKFITNILSFSLALLWIFSPVIMYLMSKSEKEKEKRLSNEDKEYLKDIAKKTWNFFKENMTNYLVTDNLQEDRREKTVKRTSATNIGLEILAIIASYDLNFEKKDYVINLLEKVIEVVDLLPKWNGHLYNWYDTEKLVPINPLIVSSVDSSNFIGSMYTLKQFLIEQIDANNKQEERINKLKAILEKVNKIIEGTNFSKLYDASAELFSIGYNCEENRLYDSYYDLLASEARQISLIAIAKKDVPSRHWNSLGRTLTTVNDYKGLVSWGGTAFEYLMPNIIIPTYEATLIDESCKVLIMSQKEYAKRLGIPWGISESAYSLKDFFGNYQYKTFGIPWLGLKRGLESEVVISPYSTALALTQTPKEAINNLRKLEKEGLVGKYGFYEAIDYKPQKQIIKSYMAHHQAMILTSIDNELKEEIFQKRFMKNPEMLGTKVLLQEKVPENVVITKNKKEEPLKIKYEMVKEIESRNSGINVISTGEFSTITYENSEEINCLRESLLTIENNVYIKDISSGKIYDLKNASNTMQNKSIKPDINYITEFTHYSSNFKLENGIIRAEIKSTIAPDIEAGVKEIKLKNKGLNKINLEITTTGTPILSSYKQYEAHPAFNNMFLRFKKIGEDKLIITRKARLENELVPYLATTLFSEEGNLEYETDKEKFTKRGDKIIPTAVTNSAPLSKSTENVLNPIIAMRRIIELNPNETKSIYLISSANYNEEKAIKNLEEYMNSESLKRVFELSKAQTEAEIRYMGIDEKNIQIYQKMLRFLLEPKKEKNTIEDKTDMQKSELTIDIDASSKNLWKYGISGDYPILLVKIKDMNDFYVIEDVFKAYEYFISKNIKTEVVIITKVDIGSRVQDTNISKSLNKRAGIFILNNVKREEQRILEARASLIIDAHDGSLYKQVKELDDSFKEGEDLAISNNTNLANINSIKAVSSNNANEDVSEDIIKPEDLIFFNGYGGFSKKGLEYWTIQDKENRLPLAWSNILTNKEFGSVVTDSMGGYTWYINSKTNRITQFTNDSYMDKTSERIILKLYQLAEKETASSKSKDNSYINDIVKEENSNKRPIKNWSLTLNDLPEEGKYYTCFGMGYVKYIHNNEIYSKCTQYVPINGNCKVSIITLKNNSLKKANLKIRYELDWQMGENKEDSRYVRKTFKKSLNMITFNNVKEPWYISYLTSTEKINEDGEINIKLEENEEKKVVFILGAEENEMNAISNGAKYITKYDDEYEETKKYWKELTSKVTSNTPTKTFDIMLNSWLVYQTIASRMMARTGFYQSSGGYGFRDQLQDSLAMKYVSPEILKNQILLCARHQFEEGDVEHWWHEDSNLGIRSRFSDDLLWLPYAVLEYIDFTGEYDILNEKEKYLKAEELKENEEDRVDFYDKYEEEGTIFMHCIKAIKRASRFGKNGLPLMKSGDWNDGMNKVGNKETGESVWLGFFLYDILTRFIELIDYESQFAKQEGVSKEVAIAINGDSHKEEAKVEFIQEVNKINCHEEKESFKEIASNLKKSLNSSGWDGRWFKRAYTDEGKEIGSIKSEECKIDSIAQSWSVISNAGDNDKKHLAIQNAEVYLIDNENNLVRLLFPALEKQDLGYITSYAKGYRENGGQYTHAAIWLMIAESILGYNNKTMEIYKKINPIEHSLTKENADKYKVEPYVVEADIISEGAYPGRGGWTWYTGSSSWLYKAQIEYILGIKISKGILTINPCVPDDWESFDVTIKYFNAEYHISYERTGKDIIIFNNKETTQVTLSKNGKYEIKKYF